jgi:hypothetical protein
MNQEPKPTTPESLKTKTFINLSDQPIPELFWKMDPNEVFFDNVPIPIRMLDDWIVRKYPEARIAKRINPEADLSNFIRYEEVNLSKNSEDLQNVFDVEDIKDATKPELSQDEKDGIISFVDQKNESWRLPFDEACRKLGYDPKSLE